MVAFGSWSLCVSPIELRGPEPYRGAPAGGRGGGGGGGIAGGEPLSHSAGWRCAVIGHGEYAQMLMRAHGMMGV